MVVVEIINLVADAALVYYVGSFYNYLEKYYAFYYFKRIGASKKINDIFKTRQIYYMLVRANFFLIIKTYSDSFLPEELLLVRIKTLVYVVVPLVALFMFVETVSLNEENKITKMFSFILYIITSGIYLAYIVCYFPVRDINSAQFISLIIFKVVQDIIMVGIITLTFYYGIKDYKNTGMGLKETLNGKNTETRKLKNRRRKNK